MKPVKPPEEKGQLAVEMARIAHANKSRINADAEYTRIKAEILAAAEQGRTELRAYIKYGELTIKLVDDFLRNDGFELRSIIGDCTCTLIKW